MVAPGAVAGAVDGDVDGVVEGAVVPGVAAPEGDALPPCAIAASMPSREKRAAPASIPANGVLMSLFLVCACVGTGYLKQRRVYCAVPGTCALSKITQNSPYCGRPFRSRSEERAV
jgi:hypothetical protein